MIELFYSEDIAKRVEVMSADERNALPFGAILVDAENVVQFYSDREAQLSGMGQRGQLGRNFFADIAPCLADEDYLGRIERARADGDIDIEMGHIGDFSDDSSELRVRIVSAPNGGLWIFHLRESQSLAA